jgi:hypothetical protein
MKKALFILVITLCFKQVNAQTTTAAYRHNGWATIDSGGTTGNIGGQCFSTDVNYPADIYVSSIITEDFNGDGFIDLATANSRSNDVSILLGTGTGTFGATTNFALGINPSSPSNFGSICSADFNNDGFKDITVTNAGYDTAVFILLGTGTGSFGTPTYIHTENSTFRFKQCIFISWHGFRYIWCGY